MKRNYLQAGKRAFVHATLGALLALGGIGPTMVAAPESKAAGGKSAPAQAADPHPPRADAGPGPGTPARKGVGVKKAGAKDEGGRAPDDARPAVGERTVTTDDVIHLAMTSGFELQRRRIEHAQAGTAEKRGLSPYTPKVFGEYSGVHVKDKETSASVLQGTESHTDTYRIGVAKQFSTGTYFEFAGSRTRFDSNAGDSQAARALGLGSLSQPPLYTGALQVTIRQELLRNAFGYNERIRLRVARIGTLIERDRAVLAMSNALVNALVDFWNLQVAERNLVGSEELVKNTLSVRSITARKSSLGLADRFELNQWNSLVLQAQTARDRARLDREEQAAALARTLGVSAVLRAPMMAPTSGTGPPDIDLEADIRRALMDRPDIRTTRRQMTAARLQLQMARNSRLPSVTLGATHALRDQATGPKEPFSRELTRGLYPESRIDFRIEMPIGDPGTKAEVRNAELELKRLALEYAQIERQIADELRLGLRRLRLNHAALVAAADIERESKAYYYGLLRDYGRGRSSAVAIKTALDALIDAGNRLTREHVNYNISLLRYDLARNNVLHKYGVDFGQ